MSSLLSVHFFFQVSWHDLAFFDPTLYESLRLLIEDSKRADSSEFFSSLDLTYYIQLSTEEGNYNNLIFFFLNVLSKNAFICFTRLLINHHHDSFEIIFCLQVF